MLIVLSVNTGENPQKMDANPHNEDNTPGAPQTAGNYDKRQR